MNRQSVFDKAAKVAMASDYERLMLYAIKHHLSTSSLGS